MLVESIGNGSIGDLDEYFAKDDTFIKARGEIEEIYTEICGMYPANKIPDESLIKKMFEMSKSINRLQNNQQTVIELLQSINELAGVKVGGGQVGGMMAAATSSQGALPIAVATSSQAALPMVAVAPPVAGGLTASTSPGWVINNMLQKRSLVRVSVSYWMS